MNHKFQNGVEIDSREFQQRFEILGQVVDPFERYYTVGEDKNSGRRVIIKAYHAQSAEQEAAIAENLQNYSGLDRVAGLCSLICYAKVGEEIDAAFDFHKITLEEYLQTLNSNEKQSSFFIKLLHGLVLVLLELKLQQVEVDDIRPSNIVLDFQSGEPIFKIFYDERQKNKSISIDSLYLSPERLEEWSSGEFGTGDFEAKIAFECGLLVLDLMTHENQQSLYLATGKVDLDAVDNKLLQLQQKYNDNKMAALLSQMLSQNPQNRLRLKQILQRSYLISQSRNVKKSMVSNIPSNHQHTPNKSANHSVVDSVSNYTNSKKSMMGARVFSDLDFLFVSHNTPTDALQLLRQTRVKIDQLHAECKKYQDGSVYYGQLQGSMRQGLGIYSYAHGDIYFGTWANNSATNGTYIFQSGQTYQGGVKNGKHGNGYYRYANGNVYEGGWENDLKEGRGHMTYSNGDWYDGGWNRGKKHGEGIYQYSNGIRYQGGFDSGFKCGKCTIIFPDKSVFQGLWQESCIQGLGKMMYDNGDQHEGNYEQSMKNGPGIFKWSNNVVYEGAFSQDAMTGDCVIRYPNGEVYDGRVLQGIKEGQGMYRYENGDTFRGVWKNDQKWQGQYSFYDGSVFQGTFRDNAIFHGRMIYQNGDSYHGEFKYGQRDGRGKYVSGGQVIEGEWRSDTFLSA